MAASASLPRELYDAAGSRALDRAAIEGGIDGFTLMNRAGAAAFAMLRRRWPEARRVWILCGTGNNGGDGFVVARLAREAGLAVDVVLLGDPARVRGDAALALTAWRATGAEVRRWQIGTARPVGDVVVDALFGTGLDRPLGGEALAAVTAVDEAGLPVLALDIPSGLHADTGAVLGGVARASATITFIALKPGLLTGAGPACCGALGFDALAVPAEIYASVPPVARRIDYEDCRASLGPRSRIAHKGNFGHVLVVGGEHGYAGAARLAGEAALRCGAGLVSVATRERHIGALLAGRPELMVHGVEEAGALGALLARASVVVLGPGLGQGQWGRALFDAVLRGFDGPMVIDADALNLLAGSDRRRANWVLTPHPGEAARLLGSDTARVQADRLAAAAALVARHAGCAVLKGAGSIVAAGEALPAICSDGNPGMASGGMGDVLAGVLAALLAQGQSPAVAARNAVCLHARAGDTAAAEGERGLLAGDLFAPLRRLANPH